MINILIQTLFTYFLLGLIISFFVDIIFYTKKKKDTPLVGFGEHFFFGLLWPYFVYCLIKELI